MTEPTRQQYMDGEVSFADFYRAINRTAGITLKGAGPLLDRVRAALLAGDEHLNTIPLALWDSRAASVQTYPSAFRAHGDHFSLAGGVCAMKQAARDAATQENTA